MGTAIALALISIVSIDTTYTSPACQREIAQGLDKAGIRYTWDEPADLTIVHDREEPGSPDSAAKIFVRGECTADDVSDAASRIYERLGP